MDLRAIHTPPTDDERACVDAVLGEGWVPPRSLRAAREERHRLLPGLHAIQRRFGYITPGALGYLADRLHVPPAEAYGVASFYALFALTPRAPTVIHVCDDIACRTAGAYQLCEALARQHGVPGAARCGATWLRSPCLGLCERAPAVRLTVAGTMPFEGAWGPATADTVLTAMRTGVAPVPAQAVRTRTGGEPLRVLERVGCIDPESLDDYRAHGGYRALRRALERGAAWVIRELTDAGLSGRGGAAFPAGHKWGAVARASGRVRHVVCNADESEPGTFKDRVLMEGDPFAVLEGMTIAGFAVGAERGWVYLRAEYPLAAERMQHAIDVARRRGLLGDDILGRRLRFDVELRRGAGAYICGEETALLNSIEGYRGEPRTKPPFPVEVGLFGQPTLVHNVETLAHVSWIVREGAAAFRAVGTKDSPGTRLFCVSGAVRQPGVYEHPFGVSLGEVIARAGGLPEGRALQAVLLGGAAGNFVGPEALELPLTLEDTQREGVTLGSGVVFVVDETVSLGDLLRRITTFFREESCGQCVPCRVGTVRVDELVARLTAGRSPGDAAADLGLLRELAQVMRDASICGLGQTAVNAVESAFVRLQVLHPGGAPR